MNPVAHHHTKTGMVCQWALLLGGWVAAGSAMAQTAPAAGQGSGIYTCTDLNGRRLTADRPIVDCIDREQRELAPSGTVRRVVGPTLTEHERVALEAQRRKEQEERNRLLEERRRDRVLIARYPDKATHDAERASAIASVDDVTTAAAKRIVELQRQRKALDTEMEFYRKDPTKAPMTLRRMLAENEEGVAEQQRFIAGQDKEKRRVHQRFDVELAQLKKLWAQQQGGPVVRPAGPVTEAAKP